MCRTRTFGTVLLDAVGVAMLIAGPVMVVRGLGGRREIRGELAAQEITFPDRERLPADLAAFAGRRLETGPQARAYSELIKANLAQAAGGRTYAQISADLTAVKDDGGRDEKLSRLRQTVFMGETLRASLMSAYQAWHLTSLVSGLGALLTGLGAALLTSKGTFTSRTTTKTPPFPRRRR